MGMPGSDGQWRVTALCGQVLVAKIDVPTSSNVHTTTNNASCRYDMKYRRYGRVLVSLIREHAKRACETRSVCMHRTCDTVQLLILACTSMMILGQRVCVIHI